jgi:hypothetical protein
MNFSQMLPMVKAMGGGSGGGEIQCVAFDSSGAVNDFIKISDLTPSEDELMDGIIFHSALGAFVEVETGEPVIEISNIINKLGTDIDLVTEYDCLLAVSGDVVFLAVIPTNEAAELMGLETAGMYYNAMIGTCFTAAIIWQA